MISTKVVQEVAQNARIALSQEETEQLTKDFSEVLDLFKTLEEVDVTGVEPTFSLVQKQKLKEQKTDVKEITVGLLKGPMTR